MADDAPAIEVLDTDVLASVLSFLSWTEILNARVCRNWKEAASVTAVTEMVVRKREIGGRDLAWISLALPNTQSFKIDFGTSRLEEFDIEDGEEAEPIPRLEGYHPPPAVDLSPIQNFHGLRHLALRQTSLNGKYPYIFQFQNLRTLDLQRNCLLKWDLEMLGGLPNLQELHCAKNRNLTGDLSSVRILSRTLTELLLCHCENVTGSLEDLYDFPLLEVLDISGTKVTGDIRTIGPEDFVSLKELGLGENIYGGGDLQTIERSP